MTLRQQKLLPSSSASIAHRGARLILGDCLQELKKMPEASVHLALTDPPYFLDRLDNTWAHAKIEKSKAKAGVVGGLPVGMKFDKAQPYNLQKFLAPVCAELFRVLKPGAFLLMFSAPRLYHRAVVAAEDAGFEVRDMLVWHYTKKAQAKAFTMTHFINKRQDLTAAEKADMIAAMGGRKTPQLRPQFEPILCAQKPRNGTFINNWMMHETGLIDTSQLLNGKTPSTVISVEKEERTSYNCHLTAKPLSLCEHLIKLFSVEEQTVLDPFVGSGTTCVASELCNRNSIGMDINEEYIEITKQRLREYR